MKLIISSLAVALATSGLAAAAPAQPVPAVSEGARDAAATTSERLELARRFVAVINPAETMLRDMQDAALEAAMLSFGEEEDAADRAKLGTYFGRLFERAAPAIRKTVPGLLEAYAQAYAREFSSDELLQMTAFAQSPAGKRYFARESFLDIDPGVLEAQRAISDELDPIAEELNRELCAEKTEQRIAAGEVNAKCPLSEPEVASG